MRAKLIALIMLNMLLRCSTAATVTTTDRRQISGELRRSPAEYQIIITGDGEQRIERARIAETDHPGKAAMVTGAALFTASAVVATILIGNRECREGCAFPIAGLTVPVLTGVSGAGIFFWGYSTYGDSKSAALPFERQAQGMVGHFGFSYRF